tara:strand:+ start:2469 stop:2819 length:351 start_codon:yes stop_codon:yes gene_type:complete
MHKLILTFIISIFAFTAQAEHDFAPEYNSPLGNMALPAQCGYSVDVNTYVQKYHFVPETFSVARVGASEDGEIAYYVTTFANDKDQHLIVLTEPSGMESCIISHSFDLKDTPGIES